jgi:hypothetical protein
VTSTNLGLISSALCGVTGVPTWGGTGAAYNTQTSDQRYSPSTTSLSNFVQIGQLLSTSNSIVAQIPSTNGFVTAAITNGLVSLPALTNYAYPLSNPSNFIPPSATNGFVNSTITNGLASLVAVTNQIQSATNQLASTNYVNGQGFVTSAVTNGLATTNQLAVYTLTNNFILGTNAVATNAYAQLIATNNALVSALAIQNSNLLASLAVSSNLLASTKQPASMTLSNLALTGAFTNFLAAGTNVLISTNISGNTLYINATNQTFLTNGMTSLAFTNPASVLYTSALPALTNGFVTSGITNGLASQSYVSNAVATSGAFTNFLAAGTNVVFSTNFSGNTISINATNQTFLTNGFSSLVFSNPAVVLYTNALPALTNGFVAASITNGFIGAAYVSNALIASNYFSQAIVAGTNVLITSNISGNTIYINATNQTFLTNGLVNSSITNGLVGASITNSLASTSYVASAIAPLASTANLTTATNMLWTNALGYFYPQSNPSNFVAQTTLNATNAALISDISASNTASLIITTNLVVASTNAGNIVFTNNPQFVNAITNPALFVASTNGNAFGLSISNYAGFWTKTNFLATTNVIGIIGNGGGTYTNNGFFTWVNPFNTNYSILLSAGNYYLQSNSVSLYQSTNIINWSQIVGANPPPVGSWGTKWDMDGVQVVGWIYSTNLTWQIINQLQNGGLNPTNGVTALQATNIANYLIGVSNVGSVYTNGNTGSGQFVISSTNAPGYIWTNLQVSTYGWQTNGNNAAVGSFIGTTNNYPLYMVANSVTGLVVRALSSNNVQIIGGYNNSIITNSGSPTAQNSAILSGVNNYIGAQGGQVAPYDTRGFVIVGGDSNTNDATGFGFIGTGWKNLLSSYPFETILNGVSNHVNSVTFGQILSGSQNLIGSGLPPGSGASTILNGYGNSLNGNYGLIGGGIANNNSSAYGVIANGSANSGTGSYSFIGDGANNSIDGNSGYGFIANGLSNSITGTGTQTGTFIGGGSQNTIYSFGTYLANCDIVGVGTQNLIKGSPYSTIVNGSQNTIIFPIYGVSYNTILNGISNTVSGVYSAILNGNYNYISSSDGLHGVANAFIIGSFATVSNNNSAIFNDATAVSTTTNNQAILYFTNGVCINTNYSGTNAFQVHGNINSDVGFSINGVQITSSPAPIQYVYWITNQTSPLPSAQIPAICYTLMGGQFIKTNSTLDTNGWYQNIADHP